MSVGTVFDVGLRIIRRHWVVLLTLTLLFVGPGALLTAALGVHFYDVAFDVLPDMSEGDLDAVGPLTQAEVERLIGAIVPYLGATLLAGVLASIGVLGLSAVVGADYHARRLDVAGALRTCLRRAPTALGFILVSTAIIVAIAVGAVLLILLAIAALGDGSLMRGGPGAFVALVVVVALVLAVVYLTMRWAPALPAVANEDLGWRQTFVRSWHLSGDNVWRIFFVVAIAALATALISSLVSQLLALLLVDVIAASLGLDVAIGEAIAITASTVLLAPLAPVLVAVLYYDLRIRRDGSIGDDGPASQT